LGIFRGGRGAKGSTLRGKKRWKREGRDGNEEGGSGWGRG